VDNTPEVKLPDKMPWLVKLSVIESANAGVANNASNTVNVKKNDFITAPPVTLICAQNTCFSVPLLSHPGGTHHRDFPAD
jgi:hypothetical protein